MSNIKITPADKYFSIWIRLRDRACKRCGSAVRFNDRGLPVSHECSHFKGRGKQATRFDPQNCDTLCYGCHAYLTAQPNEHVDWQVVQKGQKVVDALILKSGQYMKKDYDTQKKIWRERIRQDYGITC